MDTVDSQAGSHKQSGKGVLVWNCWLRIKGDGADRGQLNCLSAEEKVDCEPKFVVIS